MSESDVWEIERDLLSGSYSFSPLKEVHYPFHIYSVPPFYQSILDLPLKAFPYLTGVDGNPVLRDRTVLVAEPRDELVCRALGVVLNHKLFPSSTNHSQEQREEDRKIAFLTRAFDWNKRLGPLAKIDVMDISHLHMNVDHETLLDQTGS